MTNEYGKGADVTCSVIFKNQAKVAADPDAVFFVIKNPLGVVSTLTFGVDQALKRDSVGNYHVDVDANVSGTWFYRFHSTGSVKAIAEGEFRVSHSQFS